MSRLILTFESEGDVSLKLGDNGLDQFVADAIGFSHAGEDRAFNGLVDVRDLFGRGIRLLRGVAGGFVN